MKVKLGGAELWMGSEDLAWLKESNDIEDDASALKSRLDSEGYLLLRGFHEPELVAGSRLDFLEHMRKAGRLHPDAPWEEGIIGADNKPYNIRHKATDYPGLLRLLNSDKTLAFFERLLNGKCLTYDTKWCRAVPKEANTGAHYDSVYMNRGTEKVYTVWIPLMDISLEMGGLVICLGSNRFEQLKSTYGQADYEKLKGWFSNDFLEITNKFGGKWATTEYRAGDILIFGMYTMHGSLSNQTGRHRISADVRYQLASEPFDPRWHGESQVGEADAIDPKALDMEEARKQWNI